MKEGDLIARRRRHKNISQRALAKELGMKNVQHLWSIENNRQALPQKYVKKISDILEIDWRTIVNNRTREFKKQLTKKVQNG